MKVLKGTINLLIIPFSAFSFCWAVGSAGGSVYVGVATVNNRTRKDHGKLAIAVYFESGMRAKNYPISVFLDDIIDETE